jgi:outer membrane protein assembly factor BamA
LKLRNYICIGLLVLLNTAFCRAQQDSLKNSWILLGAPFYTPETSLGAGILSVYSFKFKNEPKDSKLSQVSFSAGATLLGQLLFYVPFNIYLNKEEFNFYGELGFYDYSYDFYGIGNEVDPFQIENFSVVYPKIRLNAQKLIIPNLYMGLTYWFEDYKIKEVEEGQLLESGEITGSSGGITSGAGITATYDNRREVFFPTKGIFAQLYTVSNTGFLSSDFDYTTIEFEAATYKKLAEGVVAFQTKNTWIIGDAPFNQLAQLGSTKHMRGYYLGRYRDKNYWSTQAEYRTQPLFWRIGFAAFAGIGLVEPTWQDFNIKDSHEVVGLGIRLQLDKVKKINLRIDSALGDNEGLQNKYLPAFYLSIGEAF